MTITAAKRSAAAGFALPGFVTIPFPDNTDDELSRWHGGFCYLLDTLPSPTTGWDVARRERVFKTQSVDRVFAAARSPRVWRFPERI
jgi:hypothetical protein